MHLILLAEGLPEGIKDFEAKMDRLGVKGGVCRLRQIKGYDLTFPKEAKDLILNEFYRGGGEYEYFDTWTSKFIKHQVIFKHIRALKFVWILVGTIGRLFGLTPPNFSKIKQHDQMIFKHSCNFYPIAFAEDNEYYNVPHGRIEEAL